MASGSSPGIQRVSRPGRRVYFGRDDVPNVLGGLGTSILTTSRGVMSGRDAAKRRRRRRGALQRLVVSAMDQGSGTGDRGSQSVGIRRLIPDPTARNRDVTYRKETHRVPKGVTVQVSEGAVEVKGPKGQLRQPLPPGISFALADGQIDGEDGARRQGARQVPRPRPDARRQRRARRDRGLQEGARHRRRRLPRGGRRAGRCRSRSATRTRWCSTCRRASRWRSTNQTHVTVIGVDRQLVGQVAANIRRLRKPDPYKQKGVRYTGEVLKKKVGKTGA